ncbi:hypothetical protein XENOCAPTIV_008117 [Xenoophorus captivus]|uniref:Uncharacterized protein n=1 Tax=Xenoophorus captivus TaxID=1517983 RepID=A0ABV0Q8V1_9TELE
MFWSGQFMEYAIIRRSEDLTGIANLLRSAVLCNQVSPIMDHIVIFHHTSQFPEMSGYVCFHSIPLGLLSQRYVSYNTQQTAELCAVVLRHCLNLVLLNESFVFSVLMCSLMLLLFFESYHVIGIWQTNIL